jgi:hypothetical protein
MMSKATKGALSLPEIQNENTSRIAVLQMSKAIAEFSVPDTIQDVKAWAIRVYGFKLVEVKTRAPA